MSRPLKIVTRTSLLARWQANFVRDCLLRVDPTLTIEIIGIQTTADQWQNVPLYKMGGKSLFVKELEHALLAKEADIAVHSLKDVPALLPAGLTLGAFLKRDDPRDAWVSPQGLSVLQLPTGARVGTSSLRRMVQLRHMRSDLTILPLRGNVDTRLKKCTDGELDAIILAMAGLVRLGFNDQITACFEPAQMLPAVGQGALGIECREEDESTLTLLKSLDDNATRLCVLAERAMNARLGGSCQIPVAGFAQPTADGIHLMGRVGDPDTGLILQSEHRGVSPEAVGAVVAQGLLAQGAQVIIDKVAKPGAPS